MKLSNSQLYIIVGFIVGNLILTIFYLRLPNEFKNVINFFSLYGTFLSVFGIAIAYLQILSLNQVNDQTKNAVEESLLKINQILSVSDLSKANRFIHEVQMSIQNGKYDIGLIRLQDLKQILIQVKYNKDLQQFTNNDEYSQAIINLSIDINNIGEFLINSKKNVNFLKVNSNLEDLSTVISNLESNLKYK